MKKAMSIFFVLLMICSIFAADVKRTTKSKDLNENGYWNEKDVQIVCDSILKKMLSNPRLESYAREHKRLPVLVIGKIANESSERIDTSIVEKKLQNAIINSGKMDFVSQSSERDILHDELRYQSDHASSKSAKEVDEETASDFMLNGSVKSMVETGKKQSQRTYFVTVQLTDIETHKIIFSTEEKIIKSFKTPKKRI